MADIKTAPQNPQTEAAIDLLMHNYRLETKPLEYDDFIAYAVFWVATHYKFTWKQARGIAVVAAVRLDIRRADTAVSPGQVADTVLAMSEEDQNAFFQALIDIGR